MSERFQSYSGITPEKELLRRIADVEAAIDVARLEFQFEDYNDAGTAHHVLYNVVNERQALMDQLIEYGLSLDGSIDTIDDPEL